MKKTFVAVALAIYLVSCSTPSEKSTPTFTTKFEQTEETQTVTYEEGIDFWRKLAEHSPELQLLTYGSTDSGLPLHLVVLSPTRDFEPESLRQKGKIVYLTNNAIHPGEPDGVEACQLWVRDLLASDSLDQTMGNVVLAIVPFYNIGGVLNRNTTSRANQNGPEAYGFRGNAQNYDLNRDFIKADTQNACAFAQLFHTWQPHVFVDTHVSNGADYQHVLTNLMTQENKLGGYLGDFLRFQILPDLNKKMEQQGFPLTPYVNVWGSVPDSGIVQFMDYPRYSTGYTSLFHTLGFMTETHMLKPFSQRVEATYAYLNAMLEIARDKHEEIKAVRKQELQATLNAEEMIIDWQANRDNFTEIEFLGYEGEIRNSEVTGMPMLFYNRERPFKKDIPFYNYYEPRKRVAAPQAYVIPQGWSRVIERLRQNQVEMQPLSTDTTLSVTVYNIANFQTRNSPYEGHYQHYNTEVTTSTATLQFRKGDWLVPMQQAAKRYLAATLEPEAPDSFFNWNFFDTILQRKEGFSAYVFEAEAASLLQADTALYSAFQKMKEENAEFAQSNYAQLRFLYERSVHNETAYQQYPIYRLERH